MILYGRADGELRPIDFLVGCVTNRFSPRGRRERRVLDFEFLIPKRPLSLQAKSKSLQAWKAFVREEAAKVWKTPTVENGDLHLMLVYLCDESPPDTDNIVKPIQDALVGLVFTDDSQIADVESHRRFLSATFDVARLPSLVLIGILSQQECVYVKVSDSLPLEEYL